MLSVLFHPVLGSNSDQLFFLHWSEGMRLSHSGPPNLIGPSLGATLTISGLCLIEASSGLVMFVMSGSMTKTMSVYTTNNNCWVVFKVLFC